MTAERESLSHPGRRLALLGSGATRLRVLGSFVLVGLAVACGSGAPEHEAPGQGGPTPPEDYPKPTYDAVSETGVYGDVPSQKLAKGFEAFAPTFTLFADGADKRRFIALPPGTVIDTSDVDHWIFPVGTRFVKEFWLDGALLETRLIERHGSGRDDYFMGAFVWSDDGSDAFLVPEGRADVRGTLHDVPSQKQCWSCHNGEAGRVLGFSSFQLGREPTAADDLTLEALARRRRLSDAPDDTTLPPPGDELTSRAFGYLHANCGHCHNLHGTAWPDTQMVLRLETGEHVAEESELYRTVVGQPVTYFRQAGISDRAAPGDPESSALVVRMAARGDDAQMPPLGTELVDEAGLLAVSEWIQALRTLTPEEPDGP